MAGCDAAARTADGTPGAPVGRRPGGGRARVDGGGLRRGGHRQDQPDPGVPGLARRAGEGSRRGVRGPAHAPGARTAAGRRLRVAGRARRGVGRRGRSGSRVRRAARGVGRSAPPDDARDRGRALVRRRHVGRTAVRRPPHPRPARGARAELPRRRGGPQPPVAARPRRARRGVGAPVVPAQADQGVGRRSSPRTPPSTRSTCTR